MVISWLISETILFLVDDVVGSGTLAEFEGETTAHSEEHVPYINATTKAKPRGSPMPLKNSITSLSPR